MHHTIINDFHDLCMYNTLINDFHVKFEIFCLSYMKICSVSQDIRRIKRNHRGICPQFPWPSLNHSQHNLPKRLELNHVNKRIYHRVRKNSNHRKLKNPGIINLRPRPSDVYRKENKRIRDPAQEKTHTD